MKSRACALSTPAGIRAAKHRRLPVPRSNSGPTLRRRYLAGCASSLCRCIGCEAATSVYSGPDRACTQRDCPHPRGEPDRLLRASVACGDVLEMLRRNATRRLLAEALAKTQRAAVAELVSRGKEQIVIIRPYQGGLVLHGMYYQNEIRDVNQVPRAESERVTPDELKLARGLLDRMSNGGFEPEKYQDEYRLRVLAMIDEKVKGREITATPQPVATPGPVST